MDLLDAALRRLDPAEQGPAREVAYRIAAGWKVREVGDYLGLTWKQVNDLRDAAAGALVAELEHSGYTAAETIRLLGVPTAAVTGRNPGHDGSA